MLGKKRSERINLKRVNCQVIGPLYLLVYLQTLGMYWITFSAVTMLNLMVGVLVEHTPHRPDLQMPSLLMN